MRLSLLALAPLVLAAVQPSKPDVDVSIKFPDSNPFGRVSNGHPQNTLLVRLANHGFEDITITRIHGQYHEVGGRERPLRNTTTVALLQPVIGGKPSPLIRYHFNSENKIGEVGLRVWVDYLDSGNKGHSVLGYDGAVTIVEPKTSWMDPGLLFIYLILSGLTALVARSLYSSFFTPPRASKVTVQRVRTPKSTTPSLTVTESTYDEDWIPKEVLKAVKGKGVKAGKGKGKKGDTSATSGEDSEGSKKRK